MELYTCFRSFVREIYDGQLFIKLKRGFEFPALDPWVCVLRFLKQYDLTISMFFFFTLIIVIVLIGFVFRERVILMWWWIWMVRLLKAKPNGG